jgi:DNA-binding NtrC family response regulator
MTESHIQKHRIIFVDDEPRVIQGLKRMLHKMGREWEMAFAQDGPEALALLDRKAFDVIVSDMKMPGLDGAGLLAEVQKRHPHMVRIVLSGLSSDEMILKATGSAHQFLLKPCEP